MIDLKTKIQHCPTQLIRLLSLNFRGINVRKKFQLLNFSRLPLHIRKMTKVKREEKKNSKPNNVNNRRNKQIDQLTRIIRSESEHEKLIFRNFTFL